MNPGDAFGEEMAARLVDLSTALAEELAALPPDQAGAARSMLATVHRALANGFQPVGDVEAVDGLHDSETMVLASTLRVTLERVTERLVLDGKGVADGPRAVGAWLRQRANEIDPPVPITPDAVVPDPRPRSPLDAMDVVEADVAALRDRWKEMVFHLARNGNVWASSKADAQAATADLHDHMANQLRGAGDFWAAIADRGRGET